jgi:hypothetical protein
MQFETSSSRVKANNPAEWQESANTVLAPGLSRTRNLARGWQSGEQKSTSDLAVSSTGSQVGENECFLRHDPQVIRLAKRNYDIYDCEPGGWNEMIS